jgi:hypothetical protein
MASARRILTYGMALVGLLATLYAAAQLLDLLLATLLLPGGADIRQDLSLYLATLLVGLPLWLVAATAAQRRARRTLEERDARERRGDPVRRTVARAGRAGRARCARDGPRLAGSDRRRRAARGLWRGLALPRPHRVG